MRGQGRYIFCAIHNLNSTPCLDFFSAGKFSDFNGNEVRIDIRMRR